MKRAIDYAYLVGKAIRMAKDGLYHDTAPVAGEHGMQCVVTGVWDVTMRDGKRGVNITGDYGMGYFIRENEEDDWHFAVFDSEENLEACGKWNLLPQTYGMSKEGNVP